MEATIPRSMLRVRRHSGRCNATSKVSYRTKRKALLFAERCRLVNSLPLFAYRCHSCAGWHLSKQKPHAKEGK
jgi:hypothetical protein